MTIDLTKRGNLPLFENANTQHKMTQTQSEDKANQSCKQQYAQFFNVFTLITIKAKTPRSTQELESFKSVNL